MSDWGRQECKKCGVTEYRYAAQECNWCECKDLEDQNDPRCPHCFRRIEDWNEEFRGADNGDEVSMQCPFCEKEFKATIHFRWEFDSKKPEEK